MAGLTIIDIGVFAHDEEAAIGRLLAALGAQTLLSDEGRDVRALILANGCTDATVWRAGTAREGLPPAVRDRILVVDLPEGGKSKTGNRFIHEFARPGADILVFMDADIGLVAADTLSRMVEEMEARPGLRAFSSRPVKDVVHLGLDPGPVGRLVAAGGDGLSDFRKSICGQLFALRGEMGRRISLPAGLPVEDGFFRAMILTDLLSAPEDLDRIDGDPEVFHVYASIRGLGELIRHQTRLVIGSAVNAALFQLIRREAPSAEEARALLARAAADDGWLARTLAEELPRAPYGYVPFEFLVKRVRVARRRGGIGLKRAGVLAAGVAFDALVWLRASARMLLRPSAGHW